mmetsp:Transcript_41157/g.74362  ORF Transcript_41157/g.74362 Transcript_41157/m.74362 type:complete len:301 (+) Transcript_41157:54-956(+)
MARGTTFLEGRHVELAQPLSHLAPTSAADHSQGSLCLGSNLTTGSHTSATLAAFLSTPRPKPCRLQQLEEALPPSKKALQEAETINSRLLHAGSRRLPPATKLQVSSEFLSSSSHGSAFTASSDKHDAPEHMHKETGKETGSHESDEGFLSWLWQLLGLGSRKPRAPGAVHKTMPPETSEKAEATPPPPQAATEASSDEVVAQRADENATLASDIVGDVEIQVAEADEAGEVADNYAIYILVINILASVGMLGVVAFNVTTYQRWLAHKREFARCWQYACSTLGRQQREDEDVTGTQQGE